MSPFSFDRRDGLAVDAAFSEQRAQLEQRGSLALEQVVRHDAPKHATLGELRAATLQKSDELVDIVQFIGQWRLEAHIEQAGFANFETRQHFGAKSFRFEP